MTWRAPPRASWVERLAPVGRGPGDGGRSIVSLEPEDIVAAARVATGLGAPDIAGASVTVPIVVTGLGRSGTTLLHELLARDPDNRAPLPWELLHTIPPSSGRWPEEERSAMAILADAEVRVMDDMVPAFPTMHDNGGGVPAECIFAFAHQSSTDMFTGLYNVPSYTLWRSGVDQTPMYEWHRRILQTLQLSYSDHVEYDSLVAFMCLGLELLMDSVTAQRDSGALPPDRISDVRYHDLVRDPVGTVESLYRTWGLDVTPAFRSRLDAPTAPAGTATRPGPRLPVRGHRARPGRAPRPAGVVPGAVRRRLRGLERPEAGRVLIFVPLRGTFRDPSAPTRPGRGVGPPSSPRTSPR